MMGVGMIIGVCVAIAGGMVAALCAATDLVFVEQNKTHLEVEGGEEKSSFNGFFAKRAAKFQTGMAVGRSVGLVAMAASVYMIMGEADLWGWCGWNAWAEVLNGVTSVVLVLVMAVVFYLLNMGEGKGGHTAYEYVGYALYWAGRPIANVCDWMMMGRMEKAGACANRAAVRMAKEGEGMVSEEVKEENEVEIFRNALDFSTLKLKNIFVPRTEIVAIDIEAGVEELRELFIETNYSRILVYRGNIDSIVGYAHCSDIFDKPDDIASILNPLIVVSEEMNANTLLHILQTQRKSLALAVDEFGGTAGIITMEDIMEEIFGDIDDEYDEKDDRVMKRLSSGEYVLSGRLDVEDVNEKFNIQLPVSGDYETIAGLVLSHNNILPSKGDHVVVNGKYDFQILMVEATRIVLVKMSFKS